VKKIWRKYGKWEKCNKKQIKNRKKDGKNLNK
jgi:hypothetical protein